MSPAELDILLDKYATETLTEQEFSVLWDSLQEPEYAAKWEEWLEQVWTSGSWQQLSDQPTKERVWAAIREQEQLQEEEPGQSKVIGIGRSPRWRWVAAAILICLVSGIYLWYQDHSSPHVGEVASSSKADALPGGNRAILTLAGGRQIILDSAGKGSLAVEGNASITKTDDGKLTYQPAGHSAPAAVMYNTLSTPKGGRFQLVLPDGTTVWLNAASSITYPVAFTGRERKVTVTGETYFEVHKDPGHPFVVSRAGVDITVLGTHFNINAYDDEDDMRITLLEGSVKVDRAGSGVLLAPGDQARLSETMHLDHQVNLDAVIAWKNGSFNFNGKSLPVILRQLSRWYNVDLVYQGPVRQVNIGGEMGMDLNLSQVLKVLRKMGVNARIEKKNLIIS